MFDQRNGIGESVRQRRKGEKNDWVFRDPFSRHEMSRESSGNKRKRKGKRKGKGEKLTKEKGLKVRRINKGTYETSVPCRKEYGRGQNHYATVFLECSPFPVFIQRQQEFVGFWVHMIDMSFVSLDLWSAFSSSRLHLLLSCGTSSQSSTGCVVISEHCFRKK